MNKENWIKAAACLCAGIFLLDSLWIFELRREVDALESRVDVMETNLKSRINSLQSEMGNSYSRMEELLEKEQSMFSSTALDYKLKGSKISVSMQAFPKELSEDESIFARIYAGDRIYEKQADEDGRAEILIDMTDSIKPVFVIKSDNSVRQEALNDAYTGYLFEAGVNSIWGAQESLGSYSLTTWITPYSDELPFDPNEVAKAEFVVKNSGIREEGNGNAGSSVAMAVELTNEDGMEIFEEDAGDRIPAVLMHGASREQAAFYADLSQYADRKDSFRYDVYLCLTTKDGTRFYTPTDSVAAFSVEETSSTTSSGNGRLVPVYGPN